MRRIYKLSFEWVVVAIITALLTWSLGFTVGYIWLATAFTVFLFSPS